MDLDRYLPPGVSVSSVFPAGFRGIWGDGGTGAWARSRLSSEFKVLISQAPKKRTLVLSLSPTSHFWPQVSSPLGTEPLLRVCSPAGSPLSAQELNSLECREDKHLNGIVRSEVMGIKVLIDVAKLFPQRFQQCLPTLHPQ